MALYNYKEKRKLKELQIYSTQQQQLYRIQAKEFVIHCKGEYDIRIQVNGKRVYSSVSHYKCDISDANKRLKVYITNKELLKDYCTQEDDMKANISKIPTWEPLEVDGYQDLNIFFANALLKMPTSQQVLYVSDPNIYKIWLTDFETSLILGKGSFGEIYLVKQKGKVDLKERYALKTIRANNLGSTSPEEFQKIVLNNYHCQFTVPLKFAFRQNDNFYIFTELMQGGDLYKQINMNQFIAEQNAKFYFVEITLALNFFHENGLVYKDLKPENVLIDEWGHIFLTNYGYVYCNMVQNDSVTSTLEYTAPEVLKGSPHSFSSDFWSLGVLLYEMVIGVPPFYHENEDLVIHLIKENKIIFPQQNQQFVSKECKDLINGLLETDESKRYTMTQIKQHAWLKNIEWEGFEQKVVNPPFIPKLKKDSTITGKYFDYKQIPKQDIPV